MSGMNEDILVVDRSYLFENETLAFQGFIGDTEVGRLVEQNFKGYRVVERSYAEGNPKLKQPIPFVIIRRGKNVYLYRRLTGGTDSRLHHQYSIGVGGHMVPVDGHTAWQHLVIENLHKELNEELDIDSTTFELDFLGMINDDSTDYSEDHIGLLFVVDLHEDAKVTVKETDKLKGYWINAEHLAISNVTLNLEGWSKIALNALLSRT